MQFQDFQLIFIVKYKLDEKALVHSNIFKLLLTLCNFKVLDFYYKNYSSFVEWKLHGINY